MSGDLTSLAAVQTYLNVTNAVWDSVLSDLITQTSDAIEKYCGREFNEDTWIEYYSGTGGSVLTVKHRPITAITSIWDDVSSPRQWDSTTLIDPTYYMFETDDSGIIYFTNWVLSRSVKNVKIEYTGGYTVIPPAIVLACHKLIGGAFNKRKSDGQTGDGLGNVSFSYESIYTDEVQKLLQPYTSWAESD